MLTVTGLARRSGATPHAVRYYTRMGLLRPERDPDNGYRLYKPREVNWLRFTRQAKQLGYTLNEIKAIMHDADRGQSPCPRVREILQRRIVETGVAWKSSWPCRHVWSRPSWSGRTSPMVRRMGTRSAT